MDAPYGLVSYRREGEERLEEMRRGQGEADASFP